MEEVGRVLLDLLVLELKRDMHMLKKLAIELSEDVLKDVKFSKEKKLLLQFLYEINMDTGKLVFVSDSSSEGTQFVEGFGGIGGILRYRMEMVDFDEEEGELSSFSDDEDIF
ncbi:unnamed protein product [Medioppia subpectinata]|uniref:eRF1 domain-containing protein n=1 Tax=Medioppia subpectinata TaxID=1979941 RepID=A0A7R9KAS2_9ACAR|nr:unnamed protein product [Medioppia subpectinata]CAG2099975.1 unnamed protein product [Medioppia subpectinata]